MKIGVIGLGETGAEIVARLLRRTCHDLYVYDPDHRVSRKTVRNCDTAAEVCDVCEILFLALPSESDQLALLNGVSCFLHPGSLVVDLTPVSPAQAHCNANVFRRAGIDYLDCGIFSPGGRITEPFLCFVGGSGEAFARVCPLLRCVAPDCRHMGPSGRGQAVRMVCLALASQLEHALQRSTQTAAAMGIPQDYFLDSLGGFETVARPLAALDGATPPFTADELEQGERVAGEIWRRAQKNSKI